MSEKYFLDTNFIINFLLKKDNEVNFFVKIAENEIYYSFITRVELLSYGDIDNETQQKIVDFLDILELVPYSQEIEDITIDFRRKHNCKLPDSIIAASAIAMQATLLTSDKRLSKLQYAGFKSINPMQDSEYPA